MVARSDQVKIVMAPHRGFGGSPIIRRLADPRLKIIKPALAEVCAIRVLLRTNIYTTLFHQSGSNRERIEKNLTK